MTLRITPGRALCASITALLLNASADAQRTHFSNPTFGQIDPDGFVNGDLPPTASNWLHPAAPDGNSFPRDSASPAEVSHRNNKATLGKALYWDEQLSSGNDMACGTCHSYAAGATDIRPGPLAGGAGGTFGVIRQHLSGGQVKYGFVNAPSTDINRLATGLAAPTTIGAYVFNIQFWDGRSGPTLDDGAGGTFGGGFTDWAGLEDQAHEPPPNSTEMGHEALSWASNFIQTKMNNSVPLALCNPATIPQDLQLAASGNWTYQTIFDAVFFFDSNPFLKNQSGVTRERIAAAIATYERTLIPDQAPIDIPFPSPGSMTAAQVNGFNICRSAGCFGCHSITGGSVGSTTPAFKTATRRLVNAFDNPFTDGDRHNIGFGLTKTPTLRNVGLHRRFFSTGQFTTRLQLMNFYDNVNRPMPTGFGGFNGPGTALTPAQRLDVENFLFNALTDPRVANQTFPFDRPELASDRVPFESNEYGASTPANGAEMIANCPPLVLRPQFPATNWFKIGVGRAVANSPAFLFFSLAAAAGPVDWIAPPFIGVPAGNTSAQGIATSNVPFVMDQTGIGVTVFTQWLIINPANPAGFDKSDAARFLMFQ